ncbi:MAG: family 10 glycosylhydrolase [Kiritimatiellae bacterium]|nr:family 10 glycosylhydrolase [Kiritimatiellia bacterium]
MFVHWQSAGQDRFSQNPPPDSAAKAVSASRKHGVSLHAWVTCWILDGLPADQLARFSKEGRLMRAADGRELPWLCPSLPQNRELLISGMRSLLKLGVDGIHLDYVRYPERQGCYAPATRAAFEKHLGAAVADWPAEVLEGGPRAAAFDTFRKQVITDFVRQAREAVSAQNADALFTAAVFPTPAAAAACGQAWPDWLHQNLVDALCPMIYTEDPRIFAAFLDEGLKALPAGKANLLPGIGVSADESQADAASVASQISAVRQRGLPGFAFFAIDDALLYQTLPALFAE